MAVASCALLLPMASLVPWRQRSRPDCQRSRVRQVALALCFWSASAPVQAQLAGFSVSVTARDAQVLTRALRFFSPPHTPISCVAVVFAASDPNSRRDAEAVATLFDGSAPGGSRAIAVSSDELPHAGDCAALFAATGAPVDTVMEAARERHVPCVTGSLPMVEAGRCTMWVTSEPRVEIVINHGALVSGGMSLAAAFRMMIREL